MSNSPLHDDGCISGGGAGDKPAACGTRSWDEGSGGQMKLGIVGTGNVGCAIALAAVTRGSARDIVLVNRTRKTAEAVATDLRYGTPLGPKVDIRDGDYADLAGAGVVLITSGVNEKTGGPGEVGVVAVADVDL